MSHPDMLDIGLIVTIFVTIGLVLGLVAMVTQ